MKLEEMLTSKMFDYIDQAASLASFAKNLEISPLHLFWAMLSDSQSALNQVLNQKNIPTAGILMDCKSRASKLATSTGIKKQDLRISQTLSQGLQNAYEAALAAGDRYLSATMWLIQQSAGGIVETVLKEQISMSDFKNAMESIKAPINAQDEEGKASVLKDFCTDLIALAKQGKIDPITGRSAEIDRLMQILIRRTKNNPLLLGEPGVGKTAIVEGLALAISKGEVPLSLKNKRILMLDLTSMVAGTKYRGEFEERMKHLVDEVKKDPNLIIFIDEIHMLLGAGDSEGGMDAANMLKPALSRGEFRCIGATTTKEYKRHFDKDAAMQRRFLSVEVKEPSESDAILMLRGLKERLEIHHGVDINDKALVAAVKLSSRYISGRFLPDKAIDLIDEAASELKIQIESSPASLRALQADLIKLETEKAALLIKNEELERLEQIEKEIADKREEEQLLNARFEREKLVFAKITQIKSEIDSLNIKAQDAQSKGDWAVAAQLLHEKIPERKKELAEVENEFSRMKESGTLLKNEVDEDLVAQVLSKWTGIDKTRMLSSEKERFLQMERELGREVIGQDAALAALSRAVRANKAGLGRKNKPIGSFLFLGPTGVGKTQAAKALAKFLFADPKAMIRFDMNEFSQEFSASTLLGAAAGYVGYSEGGLLSEAVKNRPYCVLLFDEIEKAHPKLFNIFLNILDEGSCMDNKGYKIDFKNAVIIFTSNIAGEEIANAGASRASVIKEALRAYFKPEFINRLDDIVAFSSLGKAQCLEILDLIFARTKELLAEQGISANLELSAKELLLERGFDAELGARPLERCVEEMLTSSLAELILEGKLRTKMHVRIYAQGDTLAFDAMEEPLNKGASSEEGLAQ